MMNQNVVDLMKNQEKVIFLNSSILRISIGESSSGSYGEKHQEAKVVCVGGVHVLLP